MQRQLWPIATVPWAYSTGHNLLRATGSWQASTIYRICEILSEPDAEAQRSAETQVQHRQPPRAQDARVARGPRLHTRRVAPSGPVFPNASAETQ